MTTTSGERKVAAPIAARDWAMILTLGAVWGGSFFFARIAVAEMPPLALVLFRVAIAAAVLQLWLAVRGPAFRPDRRLAGRFLVMGFLNNALPFSLIFAGQTALGAGLASVLNATTPFWTALIADRLTADEKLSARKAAGIGIGIAGTAVMLAPGLVSGLGGPLWAKLCLLGAAVAYAFAFLYARRFRGVPAPLVATGQLTASTAIMLPVVLALHQPAALFAVGGGTWAAIVGLAVLSTAFAYILYFRIVASAGATNASLVTLVVPVSALLLGTLLLGERLAGYEIAGMALIGLGLLTIDGRLFARR